ncbi:MAG TPA: hypothetical protein VI485_28235 [Vicinamibacterales bacterium]|nr:hypothetical protein [Vicinamibacterales bacterium]
MPTVFADYYRCPPELGEFGTTGELQAEPSHFKFHDSLYYGRRNGGSPSGDRSNGPPDLSGREDSAGEQVRLPFDLTEVVDNLRLERYSAKASDVRTITSTNAAQTLYYFLRPMLPVSVRRHLQRARLRGWERIAFPQWPVDFTVDTLMERAMGLALRNAGVQKIPFIWFWPEGAPSCAIMTHDVEGPAGRDFCEQLMDLDDSYGIKSAFQLVPEARYDVPTSLLECIRRRGHEVNVHDLNHDGRLFQNKGQFLRRAKRINAHARKFESRGFRAGAMYREQQWFDALDVSYDMSVPNVAHLEPQRGGCCTVMPYFIGRILELPLTTIQDYSLLHILGDYSITRWKEQIDLIIARHGLISFIIHPDYLIESRARKVYVDLLTHLSRLRGEKKAWFALPRDVDCWWRSRNQMTLVQKGSTWCIEGPDSARARLAYATLQGERVVYRIDAAS